MAEDGVVREERQKLDEGGTISAGAVFFYYRRLSAAETKDSGRLAVSGLAWSFRLAFQKIMLIGGNR